jgi:hypothetical protein
MLENDYQKAYSYIDSNTSSYYERMLDFARYGKKRKVEEQLAIDKFLIFYIRHKFDDRTIMEMGAKELFSQCGDLSFVNFETDGDITVGAIWVYGQIAHAQVVINGYTEQNMFTFKKQNDQWYIDLTSFRSSMNHTIQMLFIQKGQSQEECLIAMIETLTRKKVDTKRMWEPITKKPKKMTRQRAGQDRRIRLCTGRVGRFRMNYFQDRL